MQPLWLKHGLLYHQVRLHSRQNVHYHIPMGQILVSEISMGFAGLADIFQAEMGNLMAALEYVRAYIDNLLVITKINHDNHLGKLEQVFIQLRNAGLKLMPLSHSSVLKRQNT
jgi:hypothetical protein